MIIIWSKNKTAESKFVRIASTPFSLIAVSSLNLKIFSYEEEVQFKKYFKYESKIYFATTQIQVWCHL